MPRRTHILLALVKRVLDTTNRNTNKPKFCGFRAKFCSVFLILDLFRWYVKAWKLDDVAEEDDWNEQRQVTRALRKAQKAMRQGSHEYINLWTWRPYKHDGAFMNTLNPFMARLMKT